MTELMTLIYLKPDWISLRKTKTAINKNSVSDSLHSAPGKNHT